MQNGFSKRKREVREITLQDETLNFNGNTEPDFYFCRKDSLLV